MTSLLFSARLPVLFLIVILTGLTPAHRATATEPCGTVVTLATHDGTTTRYSLSATPQGASVALVLLPGGGGHLDLDDAGCPRELTGNSLVRKRPLFHESGFVTALLGAPSDYREGDGLAGFRIEADHATDIGTAIADVRKRTGLPVWLVGTSRGAISAANAASRLTAPLTGPAAPDGLVLTSPVTSGFEGGRKAWVEQTVFSVDLAAIGMPVLVVAHEADRCIRTPPQLSARIIAETAGTREQAVLVTGGPGWDGGESVRACRGKSPHGFIDQEAEVAAGIARFIRGGRY